MEYRVDIEDLEFYAIIGILKRERSIAQKIVVHATFWYDYEKEHYLDYAKMAKLIQENIQKKRFELIEEALKDTLHLLYEHAPQIKRATLSIKKPQILESGIPVVSLTLNFA